MSRLHPVLRELCKQKSVINFDYKNYKGINSSRRAELHNLFYGQTEFHPKEQWLVEAVDIDKGETRVFSLEDMTDIDYNGVNLSSL